MTTIVDVARAAGVSTATVSRVLNQSPRVSPESVAAVTRAVSDLGYRPSRVARSLRIRRSKVWALIISDLRNPFFTDMVRGVEDVAYEAGYSLVLCNAEEDAEKEASYLELALAESVSGIILTPVGAAIDCQLLAARGVPVVTVDRTIPGQQADMVAVDNVGGARSAVASLVAGGYERIACITGHRSATTSAQRFEGYEVALEAAGMKVEEELVRCGHFREQGGLEGMRELLALDRPPDAVFVCNNLMTIGALLAIREAGLEIPRDIAIAGFDDMSWATLLQPQLTAVAQPSYELGLHTARLLLSRLQGYSGPPRHVTLEPDLRLRGSSSPKGLAGNGRPVAGNGRPTAARASRRRDGSPAGRGEARPR